MLKKIFANLVFLGLSLNAGAFAHEAIDNMSSIIASHHHSSHSSSHHMPNCNHNTHNYAVLSNQMAISGGEIIPWCPLSNTMSEGISVCNSGLITLPPNGVFLVEYTVRLTSTPGNSLSEVTVLLQQTMGGVPNNIAQNAITSNTSIGGITVNIPSSQTQITGFALVTTNSTANNVINLLVGIAGTQFTIPATSSTDANAQIMILQVR